MRTFISVEIPKNVRTKINEIQKSLPYFKGKLTEPENLHLTLKFLGDIDKENLERVRANLKEITYPSFETEINSLGFFDNRTPKINGKKIILWMHMTNCGGLQKKIDISLSDLFKKEKRFMAHLTIARIKYLKDKKEFLENIKKRAIPSIKFYVDKFYLMKSDLQEEGPKYSVIEKYPLLNKTF